MAVSKLKVLEPFMIVGYLMRSFASNKMRGVISLAYVSFIVDGKNMSWKKQYDERH